MKSRLGRPATLGSAAAAHLQLMVWCKNCRHRAEPDPAEMAERCGAETTVRDWGQRLVCGHVVRSTPPSSNDASTPIEYETISLGSSRARNY